ncbi:MAG: phosphoenolpyruvate--protein phosphotransferase [Methylotenera sp.]|uniref:phosphoenolpyruvate--protein phosphotransferase n=1 Tax=Methylotenera sp. TaxID=2051956 RepID=UPI00271A935E|nr:phosphoenolpyruvate--protein phosphotransferase [Methylotenera sp.]MDO9393609.1 phosphoenolpyruvate--protein phosphotransferase [Methylotenera sp.]MDP1523879.1 phosphoenolpyruvate--protein phosphotransferase [Methylotenera sp.]MDP3308135.1 phosphoenolpyruvate--protein phosphotransferase [Methylotenera sp.]MDP3817706.1 phosphoenolpyruvate--protein phosphotransferase [Methylotenera sp.]MDZ4210449.1 phosphoenolpyruvate--protein phosphotransferase [Methylotenera sp.]
MTSFSIHGVGVSSGIAIGQAHLISNALLEVVHYQLPMHLIDDEIKRFSDAIATVKYDLEKINSSLRKNAPAELSAFIGTHLMMLSDKSLSEAPKKIIQNEKCNAEWAIKLQMDEIVEQFEQIEDNYLRERKQDVIQVVERVIKVLLGHPSQLATEQQLSALSEEHKLILVAHDISPADAIQFKQHEFAAFITDVGGITSHTAILARSLNIPSIVALQKARDLIRDGEIIIVDGKQGVVIINPDKNILTEYKLRQEQWELEQQKLQRIKSTKAVTLDGINIDLFANIEVPDDVTAVKAAGATGIGLYRTEFLFMNRREMPDEEEQFIAYKKVAEAMKGDVVIIRTLDLGADKQMNPDTVVTCANPALGLRAIRYCLSEPQIFHTQLRALLRASHFGNIKILVPMLSTLSELRQTKLLLERAKLSLRKQGVLFNENIALGGMIEIPAAAINAEAFASELDFLSIGTNDLIQYTLAIDRTDDAVAHLYNPLHPSVLKLISMTIKAGEKLGKSVSVCGEMAGDAKLTKLLIGMGLRQLSMHPSHILSVKQQILHSQMSALSANSRKILNLTDIEKIEPLVAKLNRIADLRMHPRP